MSPSRHAASATAINIDRVMERLGIDVGTCAVPRFGLLTSCARRRCDSCTRREACSRWLATAADTTSGPPKFCPNFDLLSELYYDPAVGHHTGGMI